MTHQPGTLGTVAGIPARVVEVAPYSILVEWGENSAWFNAETGEEPRMHGLPDQFSPRFTADVA